MITSRDNIIIPEHIPTNKKTQTRFRLAQLVL